MSKSRKDAVGGHLRRHFYSWIGKDRSNRTVRRQHAKITVEALLDYEDEMAEDTRLFYAMMEDMYERMYDDSYDDFENYLTEKQERALIEEAYDDDWNWDYDSGPWFSENDINELKEILANG